MSALHWEARRKQAVVDSRLEMQRKLQEQQENNAKLYDKGKIMEVAEKMSIDPATPTSSLLHRSHAQLIKSNREICDSECRKMCEIDSRQMAKEGKYSAKIRNRYTSINYVQQY